MEFDTSKRSDRNMRKPSLEMLINAIDLQAEQMPSPYADEEFAASLSSSAGAYKKQGQQYIRFTVADTVFALPLKNAIEIDYTPEITPLPNLPQWVLGICNLRGDIVSVVDLRMILKLTSQGAGAARKLVQIRNDQISTAFMVDDVSGMRYAEDQDAELNEEIFEDTAFSSFVHHTIELDGQPIHLLDVDALMAAIAL